MSSLLDMQITKVKNILVLSMVLGFGSLALAAGRPPGARSGRYFTYDVGASSGSYNGFSYSEINLGFNYFITNYFAFRNAIFNRYGSQISSVLGIDSSLRFYYDTINDPNEVGFTLFGGPGYRLATSNSSGSFIEGGAVLKFAGLSLGAGAKAIQYSNSREHSDGSVGSKSETVFFIILAGGGVL